MGRQQWVLQCVTVCSPDLLFDDAILSIKGARTPQQSTACPMSGRPRSFRLCQFYYYATRGIVSAIIGFFGLKFAGVRQYDGLVLRDAALKEASIMRIESRFAATHSLARG